MCDCWRTSVLPREESKARRQADRKQAKENEIEAIADAMLSGFESVPTGEERGIRGISELEPVTLSHTSEKLKRAVRFNVDRGELQQHERPYGKRVRLTYSRV